MYTVPLPTNGAGFQTLSGGVGQIDSLVEGPGADDMHDDVALPATSGLATLQALAPRQKFCAFRVVATRPHVKKTFLAVGSKRRPDQIAIQPLQLQGGKKNEEWIVRGSAAEDSNTLLLGMDAFADLPYKRLLKSVKSWQRQGVQYIMDGQVARPADLDPSALERLVNDLALGGALDPESNGTSYSEDPASQRCFRWLVDEGFLEELPGGGRFTDLGRNACKLTWRAVSPARVLTRRPVDQLASYTVWELCDHLQSKAWLLAQHNGRGVAPAIPLSEKVRKEDKFIWFRSSTTRLSKLYLQCLASVNQRREEWFGLGVQRLQHFQKESYYRDLLAGHNPVREVLMDDACDAAGLPLPDGPDAIVDEAFAEPLDASASEGEGGEGEGGDDWDDDLDVGAAAGAESSTVVKELIPWGPFKFARLERGAKTAWQVECPFHRDVGDASATVCRKTRSYDGPVEREQMMLNLKAWCLAGRHCNCRASRGPGRRPHLHEPVQQEAWPSIMLEAALEVARGQPTWILEA